MTVAELPVRLDREKIAEFCRARGIRRLSLFGSVLRDDFDPDRSDIDVLAEFNPVALDGSGSGIWRMKGNNRKSSDIRWISALD